MRKGVTKPYNSVEMENRLQFEVTCLTFNLVITTWHQRVVETNKKQNKNKINHCLSGIAKFKFSFFYHTVLLEDTL